ncbi:MAG TPA: T9SS type A sorting domain-containing protein [Chitinophagales bacterium]|nr:T9SS type A sorting domain-containing protein [Chitinophagales bacterium]
MRLFRICLLILFIPFYSLQGQNVTVAGATVGNGSYATLTAAFAAINGGSQTGATITISITANTTETAAAILNQSTGLWTSLTITPSGIRTIQGNIATRLVDLNGADRVTIDGLNDGTNSLTIDNTNGTASTGTVRLYNDAQFNIIRNCTLKGSSSATTAGVIYFGVANAVSLLGNDNNTITNCIIRESSAGDPIFGISSVGTTGATTRWNSGNTISNNQIINTVNLNTAGSGAAIQLANYNTAWTISGNSIYFTSSVAGLASINSYGIKIGGGNGVNFVISGNYIGGTAANCGGTPMTWSNTTNQNKFCGIDVNVSNSGVATSIQGNTISNITLNTNTSTNILPGVLAGIAVEGGQVLIGTITGNVIGSATVNGSITVNTAATSTTQMGAVYGITILTANTYTISNNQISGITQFPATNNNAINFYGIFTRSGTGTISSNIIGSTTLLNSIQNTTGLNFTASPLMAGIYQTTAALNVTISSNTISNITSSTNNSKWQVAGIVTQAATNTISNNIIKNLVNISSNTATGIASSVVGILMTNVGGTAQSVTKNTISNLQNTNTGNGAYAVEGMVLNNSGAGHIIGQNLIYDLKNSNTGSTAPIDAIRIGQGTMTISNNMISLGNGLSNNPLISAINIQGGTPTLYYNSVVLAGAAVGTAAITTCVRMQTGLAATVFQNNILYNNRTSATSANNSAIYFASGAQVTNVTTSNYNDLYNNPANSALVVVTGIGNYSNLSAWQTSGYSKDAVSISQSVPFLNIANDLHLDPSVLCSFMNKGIAVSIVVDYDNQTRHPITPDIGADEIGNASWIGITNSDWNVSSNWSPAAVPVISSDVIVPAGTPYSCTVLNANATCHSLTVNNLAPFSIVNSKVLTVNSNSCSNGAFTMNGVFSPGSTNEEVTFNGGGTVSGTVVFNIVSTNNALTFSTTTTVNKKFRIDAGGYVFANPPIYTTGSATLQYNTGGTFGRSLEWCATSGAGYPYHVQVSNNTTLDLGNGGYNIARKCGGSLLVDAGSVFTMNSGANQMTDDLTVAGDITINGTLTQSVLYTAPYNDINVGGNWTRGAAGVFNPNCRNVFFNSTAADQTVTVTGGGIETFNYVGINKSGRKLLLGTNTDMKISALSACVLATDYLTITNGDIDLLGRTLYFAGPSGLAPGTNVMNLSVNNGTRSILSSIAGGIVDVSGTLNSRTLKVVDGGGSGKILFGNNVEVRDAAGEIDFGTGNLSTINYILRINNGGNVTGNAAYYAQGSKLIFSTGTLYDIVATEQSWESGTLGTTPGVPWDVEVNSASTDVRISDNLDRCVRNNIGILNGTFESGAPGFLSGNLTVGGNWSRNNVGTSFVPNQNIVTFNSSVNAALQLQTITMNGGGNETYYDLEENNSPGLTLTGTTKVYVTDHLSLTKGLMNTSGNEIYITNDAANAITFDAVNSSADSWVNGYLRRKITTGSYDFPVGVSFTGAAAGYELMSLNFNSNTNIDNLLVSFTTDGSPLNEFYNVMVNGTPITDRLNAGWWTVTPYNAALAPVAAPDCNYNVFLNERGYNNGQPDPQDYAVIRRNASYCYDICLTDWIQCGLHDNATQWEAAGTAHAERSAFTCNSFGDWAIGTSVMVLPIELTTFEVAPSSTDAILTWHTAAEYNSDFFAVERSIDGINFKQIGTVTAAGHSTLPGNYSFIDHDITLLGVTKIYYHLRMVDLDQSYQYSEVRLVDVNASVGNDAISVYPNPFSNQVNILWNSFADASAVIQLADITGRILIDKQLSLVQGANLISLSELPSLPDGIYFIHIISGREVRSEKLVKKN